MKNLLPALFSTALCAAAAFPSFAQNEESTSADRALNKVLKGISTPRAEKKKPAKRPDSWITPKVKAELMTHKNVSGLKTGVETTDGIVTLTGEADSSAQKDLVESYAEDVEGVQGVDNRMTVRGERSVDARIDDATITAQVKAALLRRRSTSAVNTEVRTVNGVVFLEGRARNEAEKELVERLARRVEGVKGVDNKMTLD
jgi:osmotically-inducible protein OsmY